MSMQSKRIKIVIIAIVIAIILIGLGSYAYFTMQTTTKQHLIVSTTTSLYETGLLDILKVEFEKQYPSINVFFISQGTGLAIQTAMRGDADMILVHDPVRELKFLEEGYGVNRKIIAYNFFVIAGPSDDPANVKGLSPTEAFTKIKEAGEKNSAIWVSRGDDSGTHAKEKRIWKAVGFDVADLRTMDWYLEAGTGMTATLRLTDEKNGYTLVDLGSYLNNYANGNIELEIIVDAGKDTLNVYSVIANNPRKTEVSGSNFDASMKFIEFLVSDEIQQILTDFGKDKFGKPLFNPYVKLLKNNDKPELIQWIKDLAYFDGTECPSQYRYQADYLCQIIYRELIISPVVSFIQH
ncbi:MAG: substrate-binding domain-containing protein [Candidatus Thorarchaeota archaeon]